MKSRDEIFKEGRKVVKKIIDQAAETARAETDNVPEPGLTGDFTFPVKATLNKGLEGAITGSTGIGYVNGEKGWLLYRGYNIFDLAANCDFEEVIYLLLYGDLPDVHELEAFKKKLIGYRSIPEVVIDVLKKIPTPHTHPMAALRTAISVLGTLDATADDCSVDAEREVAIRLIAQLPGVVAAIARIREHKRLVPQDISCTHACNFLYTMTGESPIDINNISEAIMNVALILHADHGMNNSTFTGIVINSSLTDMYSSIVGAIGSLKGPLHGGANERVLYMLEEIGNINKVEEWFKDARATKRKLMGFGHRVYKAYDPRGRVLKPLAKKLAEDHPDFMKLYDIAEKLDDLVCKKLGKEKRIFPNVDFYSGLVYRSLGIKSAMFTPIFAVSRIVGWTARALEYLQTNRIMRPRAVYTGDLKKKLIPIEKRKK
ncbi:citrate synthase [Candidatus Dependentiae bacterium]|nr:citrate synthase [Candidatus Dependentiae bacterium]